MVTEVLPGTPARRAGLRPGDVIVQLGNRRVEDLNDYKALLRKVPENIPVLLRFVREGQFIFRTIEVE